MASSSSFYTRSPSPLDPSIFGLMWTVDEKANKGGGVVDGRDENCGFGVGVISGFGKTVVLEVRVRRR